MTPWYLSKIHHLKKLDQGATLVQTNPRCPMVSHPSQALQEQEALHIAANRIKVPDDSIKLDHSDGPSKVP